MANLFSGATMHWIGTNLLGATDSQHAAYRHHLDSAQLPALTAAGGATFAHRLEKLVQSPRRSFGPDYLSICEFDAPPAPAELPQGDALEPLAGVHESMWNMSWRKISDTGVPSVRPDRARLLSLSPPDDATADEIADWNQFYTEVHVPEAMQRRGWTRATRWTLEHCSLHPNPGCPRYFVLYEGVGFKDATDEEVAAWGPWSQGPALWKRHVGAWTLDYRIIPPAH